MLYQNLISSVYISVIAISALCSLVSFRLHFPPHLKIFSVLLILTFVVEWFAVFGLKIFHFKTNTPLYNIFMLIEFCMYAYYYKLIFTSELLKQIATWFIYLFPVFWVVVVFFVFGIHAWNSYLIVVGSFFTVCFSAAYYYQLFTSANLVKLTKSPEFWIATGMILFYTCEMPYMGMLNFLVIHYLTLAKELLPVLTVIDTIMYLLFTYAYVCRITMEKY